MNLKINVLGNGMIPRGFGLAPRKTPFNADLTLISTIMSTPGLQVNYLNPETNKLLPLTAKNLKRVWEKYGDWENKKAKADEKAPEGDGLTPHVPGQPGEDKTPGEPVTPPAEDPKKEDEKDPAAEIPGTTVPPVNNGEPAGEKKDEVPGETKKEEQPATPAAESGEEKKDGDVPEKKEEEKKDETPAPAAPAPLRTVLNNGQKNNQNKHNK